MNSFQIISSCRVQPKMYIIVTWRSILIGVPTHLLPVPLCLHRLYLNLPYSSSNLYLVTSDFNNVVLVIEIHCASGLNIVFSCFPIDTRVVSDSSVSPIKMIFQQQLCDGGNTNNVAYCSKIISSTFNYPLWSHCSRCAKARRASTPSPGQRRSPSTNRARPRHPRSFHLHPRSPLPSLTQSWLPAVQSFVRLPQ